MVSGATQIAILDLRKEDAEKAGKEMVAKFGEHSNQEVSNSMTSHLFSICSPP